MKGYLIIILLQFWQIISIAQDNNQEKYGLLPSTVNSEAEELMPLMHPHGNELYFSRVFHPENYGGEYGGSDIWVSQINANGDYEEAIKLPKPINNKENNFVIGFSADGKRMYLNNSYKSSSKYAIAIAYNLGDHWSDPSPIEIELPPHEGPIGMYMHPGEKILLISMNASDSYGKEDLYVMTKDSSDNWSEPLNLGATINTQGFEISPFLSEDGKTLYFASEGHGGKGSADIFKAVKKYNVWNVWSKPMNMGPIINSKGFEGYMSIFQKQFLFASNRNRKLFDLYGYEESNLIYKDSTTVQIDRLLDEAKELLQRDK
ncbi:MAG: hypothetical protein ACOCWM_01265 [Cyclobacteriaceae bacterium]